MVGNRLVCVLVAALASCATRGHLPGPGRTRSWPPPPERPRIGLLGSFRGPGDLGIRGGLGGRLKELVAGITESRLYRPYAVAAVGAVEGTGPGGGNATGPELLAVSDTEAKVVHVFDLAGGRHRVVSTVGAESRLLSPVAVAFDAERRLYVCDSALGLVVRYTATGKFDRIVSRGLRRPSGLALDRDRGILYAADAAEHTVRRFSLDGDPLGAVGGDLRFPTHLAVDPGGRIVVADTLNARVLVLEPDGRTVVSTGTRRGDASGDMPRPKGVGLDARGRLFVVDALFDNVQIFDLRGALLLAFGSAGDAAGEFALPAGLALDEQGLVYVADSYNGRVQVFRVLEEDVR